MMSFTFTGLGTLEVVAPPPCLLDWRLLGSK